MCNMKMIFSFPYTFCKVVTHFIACQKVTKISRIPKVIPFGCHCRVFPILGRHSLWVTDEGADARIIIDCILWKRVCRKSWPQLDDLIKKVDMCAAAEYRCHPCTHILVATGYRCSSVISFWSQIDKQFSVCSVSIENSSACVFFFFVCWLSPTSRAAR